MELRVTWTVHVSNDAVLDKMKTKRIHIPNNRKIYFLGYIKIEGGVEYL